MTEEITWKSLLTKLVNRQTLNYEENSWWINALMNGQAPEAATGAVMALQMQSGLTIDEITAAVDAMLKHAEKLDIDAETTDIVGTGGDGAATVNLSTMASIAAAAAGVKIVKHGNRAASSKSGAADCLEQLGLPLELSPENAAKVFNEVGITFAFAKTFHPAMRFVAPVRKALGIPTVFNILGPLTNPAGPKHVAVGSADRKLSPLMAQVYASRGQTGFVFTSCSGFDEMVADGPVTVWDFADGNVKEVRFDPAVELSIPQAKIEDIRGDTPEYNAKVLRDFVNGENVPSRSTALLNAAAAIAADGKLAGSAEKSLSERFANAYRIAQETVDSGKAAKLLDDWITVAKKYA